MTVIKTPIISFNRSCCCFCCICFHYNHLILFMVSTVYQLPYCHAYPKNNIFPRHMLQIDYRIFTLIHISKILLTLYMLETILEECLLDFLSHPGLEQTRWSILLNLNWMGGLMQLQLYVRNIPCSLVSLRMC